MNMSQANVSETSMTFGPEWLRNLPLTGGGGLNITSPPRSPIFVEQESGKIVYNKEELIQYYKKVKDIPRVLEKCPVLLHPEPLLPMTMIPLSEEEQRNAASVNSAVALRMTGRGGSHPRGRGSVRGRGRGRGDAYYIRTGSDDGNTSGHPTFTRSRSGEGKSSWDIESPRDGQNKQENNRPVKNSWRSESLTSEDDNGWKFAGRGNNPNKSPRVLTGSGNWRSSSSESRTWNSRTNYQQKNHYSNDDSYDLPEWSQDGVDDIIGTFDGSGAFCSQKMESGEIETFESDNKSGIQVEAEENSTTNDIKESDRQQGVVDGLEYVAPVRDDLRSTVKDNVSATIDDNKDLEEHLPESLRLAISDDQLPESLRNVIEQLDTESCSAKTTDNHQQQVVDNNASRNDMSMRIDNMGKDGNLVSEDEKWLYQDPQGKLQGPFGNNEMLEWLKAGFFAPNLPVKRACDDYLLPLGKVIRIWKRIPFQPGPAPPPFKISQEQVIQHQQYQQPQHQQSQHQHQQSQHQQSQHQQQQQMAAMAAAKEQRLFLQRQLMAQKLMQQQQQQHMYQHQMMLYMQQMHLQQQQMSPEALNMALQQNSQNPTTVESESDNRMESHESNTNQQKPKSAWNMTQVKPADAWNGSESNQSEHKVPDNQDQPVSISQSQLEEEWVKNAEGRREKQTQPNMAILEESQSLAKQHQQLQSAASSARQASINMNISHEQWKMTSATSPVSLAQIQAEEARRIAEEQRLRQQQVHLQQQQTDQNRSFVGNWVSNSRSSSDGMSNSPISLVDIQKEQSSRNEEKLRQQQMQTSVSSNVTRTSGWGSSPMVHQNVKVQPTSGNSGPINSGLLGQVISSRGLTNETVKTRNPLDETTLVNRPNPSLQSFFHPDISNKSAFPELSTNKQGVKTSQERGDVTRGSNTAYNPENALIQWCERRLAGIETTIDIPTFARFISSLGSPAEVRDYLKMYLGSTEEVKNFFNDYVRKRRECESQQFPKASPGNMKETTTDMEPSVRSETREESQVEANESPSPTSKSNNSSNANNSNKKKKKRMQKVDPSILGFSGSSGDRINQGAIQSLRDVEY
ncbi:PERQ amino acid-rich with GYF domain-containing protein 1 [Trichoplax sp. H2]|nr:PERQ amino acid-rich with GYF domain-containing protein 1 [Trichoplax sp. H2]|eukprot:RDD44042.1 PERQ amino acid-rich with GYF domain-containing protein 1 [Trichoplax sp. H2]